MGKTLLTPRHPLNAFSDPRWTWKLVEASKNWLPILHLVVYANWNLTFSTRQGSRVSCLAQTGFTVFGKGVQLIGAWFFQFSRPTVTGIWEGIQWVPRGKQYLPQCRLSPNCGYLSSWGGNSTAWRGKSGKLSGFSIGGPTDELHPFTKSSETGLG